MNLYLCGIMVVMVGPNGIFPNVYGVQKPVDLLDLSASKTKLNVVGFVSPNSLFFSNYLPLGPRRAAESQSAVRVSGDA
jgi:hypothetical protein